MTCYWPKINSNTTQRQFNPDHLYFELPPIDLSMSNLSTAIKFLTIRVSCDALRLPGQAVPKKYHSLPLPPSLPPSILTQQDLFDYCPMTWSHALPLPLLPYLPS